MTPTRLFDSDGSNPYSRELARLLVDGGWHVELIGPADIDGFTRSLRPRFSGRGLLLSELWNTFVAAFGRPPVIVAWARTYQKLVFALGARLRRRPTFVVVHNPTRERWPTGLRGRIELAFLRSASCICHSESLRQGLLELTGIDSRVAPHPLYLEWVHTWVPPRVPSGSGAPRFLLLGRLAPEKFDGVDALFGALERSERPSTVRVLTRPRIAARSGGRVTTIEDRSSDEWIQDGEVGEALAWADVLLAPYPGVTESGTVQLALSAGTGVVAFDGGALRDTLSDDALVAMGDYDALVSKAFAMARGEAAAARVPLDERTVAERLQWSEVLRGTGEVVVRG